MNARRGSRENPCETRGEAITLAKQDAGATGGYLFTIKEEEYAFLKLNTVPILSKIYYTHKIYQNPQKTEQMNHIAIQDHYLGHFFAKENIYEPPHIHATQLDHVKKDHEGKPTVGTIVNRHYRVDGCQEHYYYREKDDDPVSEDENETDPMKRGRKLKYKELRKKRDDMIPKDILKKKLFS